MSKVTRSSLGNRDRINILWMGFMSGNPIKENLSLYERAILQEWKRCKGFTVDPFKKEGVLLSSACYEGIIESNRRLINKSLPILKNIADLLTNEPIIIVLADPQGNIVKVMGDKRTKEKAFNVKFSEGTAWKEELAGNNGIGTAIQKRAPVHVYGSEHFCEKWHSFSCVGSPILDPLSGDILGIIDITTLADYSRYDAMALAYSLSSQVQLAYKVESEAEHFNLVNHYLKYCSKYSSDGVMLTDCSGNVVRINDFAKAICREQKIESSYFEKRGIEYDSFAIPSVNHQSRAGNVYIIKRDKPLLTSASANTAQAFGGFVTIDRKVIKMMEEIKKIANTSLSLLLTGETGTGKELVARHIHESSSFRKGPFVAVNCGNIHNGLFSSMFYGYEHGAYTGADPRGRKGYFQQADGGTLFLDEIGEMPLDLQSALLRVLETKSFSRLGSEKEITVDFRIIAATNRDLKGLIKDEKFRSDLFYRLNAASFSIPPLRERHGDIRLLISRFTEYYCKKYGLAIKTYEKSILQRFINMPWYGNVRELGNVLETLIVLSGDEAVISNNLPVAVQDVIETVEGQEQKAVYRNAGGPVFSLQEYSPEEERDLILSLLKEKHKVYQVAREMGISRSTLYRRFKLLGINPRRVSRGTYNF